MGVCIRAASSPQHSWRMPCLRCSNSVGISAERVLLVIDTPMNLRNTLKTDPYAARGYRSHGVSRSTRLCQPCRCKPRDTVEGESNRRSPKRVMSPTQHAPFLRSRRQHPGAPGNPSRVTDTAGVRYRLSCSTSCATGRSSCSLSIGSRATPGAFFAST